MVGFPSRASLRRLPPVPTALFVVCLAAASAGCAKPVAPEESVGRGFPEYAATVLRRGSELAATPRGFEVIRTDNARVKPSGEVVLPKNGSEAILFVAKTRAEVRVREAQLAGAGRLVDRAVTYAVPGGASFWQATTGGAEEWFSFDAGAVKADRPAAMWEVAGATPVKRGQAVTIVSESGKRVLTVTAPLAVLADGSRVPVRLSVRGSIIELYVDTRGQAALVDPSWTFVSPMNFPRVGHRANRLTDGTVLVAGGETAGALDIVAGGFVTSASETYDPFGDFWQQQNSMGWPRVEHAMVTQPGQNPPDGAALVSGGIDDIGNFLPFVEVYENGGWSQVPDLLEARAAHTATRLQDDRVLVAGGYNGCGGGGSAPAEQLVGAAQSIGSGFCYVCTSEVFDPNGGGSGSADAIAGSGNAIWNSSGNLNDCRAYHTETLLDDGRVLIVGGEGPGGVLASAEIWSPQTDTWVFVASMAGPREFHTATLLTNGTVLVTGGNDGSGALTTAEIYDPAADSWTSVNTMQANRSQHAAVRLNDGSVLLTGGRDNAGNSQFSSEIYDPAAQQFNATVDMNDYHAQHTETLLLDGNVLVAGGDNLNGNPPISAAAEIFALAGLLGQPCMQPSDCGSNFCVDGVCCDTVCDQPCEACTDVARGGVVPQKKFQSFSPGVPNGNPGSGGGDGFCGPVFAGEDPANDCASLDPSTCGTVGECDGNGACELYADGTICQVPGCMGTVAQGGGLCDGLGTCVTSQQGGDCAPYDCVGGVCKSKCTDASDCSPFAFCDGIVHLCAPKKATGSVAFDPVQCLSGFVASGVCCDEACDTPCHACSKPLGASADGTCTPISNVQCDDGSACTKLDVCQSGFCVGGQAVSCPGNTGCQGGLACDPKTGQCTVDTPPLNVGDPCTDGSTCTTGDVCVMGGACKGNSVACNPSECQSAGMCVEGVGCQFDDKPDYTSCTADDNPCTIDWCITGTCTPNNATDLTPCPGGVCFAGTCVPDGSFNPTGGTGTGTGTGGAATGGGGPGGGVQGGGGAAGTSTGTGASASNNGDEPAYKLVGAGCSTSGGGSSGAGWAGALLGLAALAGSRRRRRQS